MAVALPKPYSVPFPHNILQGPNKVISTMDQPNSKPSLPSISSLIEAVKDQPQNGSDRSPNYEHQRKLSGGSSGHAHSPERSAIMGSPRSHPPPTPPLPGPSSFDFPHHSPGSTSPKSNTASQSSYYAHAPGSTNPENYAQRSSYPPIPETNQWTSTQGHSPTESRAQEISRASVSAYPDPPSEGSPYSGLAQQRPLPANFPPPIQGQSQGQGQALPPIDPQMAPTWQHHHYYPPANPPAYPPPSERYVCPTCQKPFSRPSSLKIHTYSHTGEKPFKCKHDGCGKYFSVRSNMKRHEKGCHGGDGGSAGGNSPQS